MSANRPLWDRLTRRNAQADTATELYGRLVAQARAPAFYARLGVPDTPEGRLELILLHVVLMLRRLGQEGEAAAPLARALSETFVTDMDDCLREMGVGDLSVAKKVKKAAAALFDRSRDYGQALATGDRAQLAELIGTHVLELPDAGRNAETIAGYVVATEAALEAAPRGEILAGQVKFPDVTG